MANTKRNEAGDPDVTYIRAKLEAIHEDVSLLKTQVDDLRQTEAGKKAVSKFVVAALAILGTTVGWLVDNAVTVAQHITIR